MFVDSSIHLETANRRQHDPLATGRGPGAPARELAQRRSGTDEVLLLWHPESDRVELSVLDAETGAGFSVDVAPESAIDAFYHPYSYMARRENVGRVVSAVQVSLDG